MIKVEAVKLMLRLVILAHRRSILLHSGSYVPPVSPIASDITPPVEEEDSKELAQSFRPGVEFNSTQQLVKSSEVFVGRRSGKCFHFPSTDLKPHRVSATSSTTHTKAIAPNESIDGDVRVKTTTPVWLQADVDLDSLLPGSPPHITRTNMNTSTVISEMRSNELTESRVRWIITSEVLFFSRPLVQLVLK
jgi:hypothetical protein